MATGLDVRSPFLTLGCLNRVHRCIMSIPAQNAVVRLFFAVASPGPIPPLPAGFWSQFPSDVLPAGSAWVAIGAVASLATLRTGRPQVTGFQWDVPLALAGKEIWLLALVTAKPVLSGTSAPQRISTCPEDFRTARYHSKQVKSAFAEGSVSDRVSFARWESSNRTACEPSRETSRNATLLTRVGHFLRVRSSCEICKIAGISGIFQRKADHLLCS
jgi:hypothetical protein